MLRKIHTPQTMQEGLEAKKTVFFKRLLKVQLHSQREKEAYQAQTHPDAQCIDRTCIKTFLSTLPFTLTNAQKRALKDIIENIHEPKSMLRLLQ